MIKFLWINLLSLAVALFGGVLSTDGVELKEVHSFIGHAGPLAELIQGDDGAFYGTTAFGGEGGYGAVFRVTTNGTLSLLKSFSNVLDGGAVFGGLTIAGPGKYYGTLGGGLSKNLGGIFSIYTNGAFSVLAAC